MNLVVGALLWFTLVPPPGPVALTNLTVPRSRLSETCVALSNPWLGTQRSQLAFIRQSFGPERPMRDRSSIAPPSTGFNLIDGIDAGYEAIYGTSAGKQLLKIYGLRFRSAGAAKTFWGNSRVFRSPNSAVMGPIVAYVSGEPGSCRDSVVAYVKSLAR